MWSNSNNSRRWRFYCVGWDPTHRPERADAVIPMPRTAAVGVTAGRIGRLRRQKFRFLLWAGACSLSLALSATSRTNNARGGKVIFLFVLFFLFFFSPQPPLPWLVLHSLGVPHMATPLHR